MTEFLFGFLKFFNVSSTIACTCLGVDTHASRQSRCYPAPRRCSPSLLRSSRLLCTSLSQPEKCRLLSGSSSRCRTRHRHALSKRASDQLCGIQLQCVVFGTEELFLVFLFVGIQRVYWMRFSPYHWCLKQTPENMERKCDLSKIQGCENTRLLVSYASDDPRRIPSRKTSTCQVLVNL